MTASLSGSLYLRVCPGAEVHTSDGAAPGPAQGAAPRQVDRSLRGYRGQYISAVHPKVMTIPAASVGDPDPDPQDTHVFRPPGSRSGSFPFSL
jgi:hypothetical protein